MLFAILPVQLPTLWKKQSTRQGILAAMPIRLLSKFSFILLGFLVTMLPMFVFCQGQFSQNFAVAETGRHYCPGPRDATSTSYAKSRIKCAAECTLHGCCICFSYYATSRQCYLYSVLPKEMLYDDDCTFMTVSFHNKQATYQNTHLSIQSRAT